MWNDFESLGTVTMYTRDDMLSMRPFCWNFRLHYTQREACTAAIKQFERSLNQRVRRKRKPTQYLGFETDTKEQTTLTQVFGTTKNKGEKKKRRKLNPSRPHQASASTFGKRFSGKKTHSPSVTTRKPPRVSTPPSGSSPPSDSKSPSGVPPNEEKSPSETVPPSNEASPSDPSPNEESTPSETVSPSDEASPFDHAANEEAAPSETVSPSEVPPSGSSSSPPDEARPSEPEEYNFSSFSSDEEVSSGPTIQEVQCSLVKTVRCSFCTKTAFSYIKSSVLSVLPPFCISCQNRTHSAYGDILMKRCNELLGTDLQPQNICMFCGVSYKGLGHAIGAIRPCVQTNCCYCKLCFTTDIKVQNLSLKLYALVNRFSQKQSIEELSKIPDYSSIGLTQPNGFFKLCSIILEHQKIETTKECIGVRNVTCSFGDLKEVIHGNFNNDIVKYLSTLIEDSIESGKLDKGMNKEEDFYETSLFYRNVNTSIWSLVMYNRTRNQFSFLLGDEHAETLSWREDVISQYSIDAQKEIVIDLKERYSKYDMVKNMENSGSGVICFWICLIENNYKDKELKFVLDLIDKKMKIILWRMVAMMMISNDLYFYHKDA